jgi:hypothetical protein
LLLEAGGLLFEDRVDPGVRRVGDEMQAIVFGLDQFLTHFSTRLFLGKRVGRDACHREESRPLFPAADAIRYRLGQLLCVCCSLRRRIPFRVSMFSIVLASEAERKYLVAMSAMPETHGTKSICHI